MINAINPFDAASKLRGNLNKATLKLANGVFAEPTAVPLTAEPNTGDNNSLRTLMGQDAPDAYLAQGGLVRRVVAQQRQQVLPRMAPATQEPQYKAEGGPVEKPRPTTYAEDTVDAKLNPDEYVIPAEAVRRKGTDFWDAQVRDILSQPQGRHPTMMEGKVYAAFGGDPQKTLEDEQARTAKLNAPLSSQVDSAIQSVNATAGKQAISDANARVNATKIPLNTDTVKTGSSALSRGIQTAIDAVNPKNFSPETQKAILANGDSMLGAFKDTRDTVLGAAGNAVGNAGNFLQSGGSTYADKRLEGAGIVPAHAITAVEKLGKPAVKSLVDTVQAAAGAGGKVFNELFALPQAKNVPAPPVQSPAKATPTSTGSAAPVSGNGPSSQPAYRTTTLPDGSQRLELTQPTGEKITPAQIAATDAADAKRLGGLLNFANDRVAKVTGTGAPGTFDPMEQYRQKLAADLAFQQQRDTAKEIQYRNYGQVFPEERVYAQPDNSPLTQQMQIDEAKRISAIPGQPEYSTDKYGRIYQTKGQDADKFNQGIVQQQAGEQEKLNALKQEYFSLQPPSADATEDERNQYKAQRARLENIFRTWDPETAKLIDKQKISGML